MPEAGFNVGEDVLALMAVFLNAFRSRQVIRYEKKRFIDEGRLEHGADSKKC